MVLAFDFAHDVAAAATLITAVGGFVAVLFRQGRTEAKVTKVEQQVNGTDEPHVAGEPLTLGQSVREISDRLARIERELGVKE